MSSHASQNGTVAKVPISAAGLGGQLTSSLESQAIDMAKEHAGEEPS